MTKVADFPDDGYLPIAEHGLIGDLRTAALVGSDATIDWFCAPRFDSPSVFASLLDPERGGSWRFEPRESDTSTRQFYLPDSAILVTRFLTEEGVAEVHDFMPLRRAHDTDHRQALVRRVISVRGRIRLGMIMTPRMDYASIVPTMSEKDDLVVIEDGAVTLRLQATLPLAIDSNDARVVSELDLCDGQEALFVLHVEGPRQNGPEGPLADDEIIGLENQTQAFWRDWLSRSTYTGRWREMVDRSALTLKLLTHEPSGAIIAAPTTSLPEVIGGERNWDYRFVWIRDAAFSLYALLRLGFTDEAQAFIGWLADRLGENGDEDLGPLRVLYDLDGNLPTDERTLDYLRGYRDSEPVRVGNAAVDQLQLDIVGELIDSVYLYDKYGAGISYDTWMDLTKLLEWLMQNWDRDDSGMWESRGGPKPHTSSRVMCWVAIERMMRTARRRGLPGDLAKWGEVRDRIYTSVMDKSWNPELEAFTQYEGAYELDAGVLLMPLVKFITPTDPKFVSTLAAIENRLVSDTLVFRYDVDESSDGLPGEEGTFSLCSFWYVEALTRVGRVEDARLALEKMFSYANHLGLYSEQVALSGHQLGNFPQAFTHLSLISAAINLNHALDGD